MNKLIFKSFVAGALFLGALFSMNPNCLAAEEVATPAEKKAVTVATVNVYGAKIISQEGNDLKISFDLNNRIGIQSGIRYGIELHAKEAAQSANDKGVRTYTKSSLADQQMYAEMVTLRDDETIKKEVVYVAPEYLQGKFEVFVVSKNEAGLFLANTFVGEVDLAGTGKYLEIKAGECAFQIGGKDGEQKLNQLLSVASEETVTLKCSAVNRGDSEVSATPHFETRLRSDFGPIVSEEKKEAVLLKSGEETSLALSFPAAKPAQTYAVRMTLKDVQGRTISNPVDFSYVVQGTSATIRNATFDMRGYLKGNTASIFVLWMSQGRILNQETGEQEKITLKTSIVNADGAKCAEEVEIKSDDPRYDGMETIQMPILKECLAPKVTVALLDAEGAVLDEKVLGFQKEKALAELQSQSQPSSKSFLPTALYVIAGLILVVGIVLVVKKKRSGMIGIFALVFAGGMLLVADSASAETTGIIYVAKKDGIAVVKGVVGKVIPSGSYDIGAWAEMVYDYNQCGTGKMGGFDGTVVDGSWGGHSNPNLHYDSHSTSLSYSSDSSGLGVGIFDLRMNWAWKDQFLHWHNEIAFNLALVMYSGDCGTSGGGAVVNAAPTGYYDGSDSNCNISGWAADPSDFNQSIHVHVYRDGPAGGGGVIVKDIVANLPRTDVKTYLEGAYGVSLTSNQYAFADSLRNTSSWTSGVDDGLEHSLYIYAIDISGSPNPLLGNSPGTTKIKCVTPAPTVTQTCNPPSTDPLLNISWGSSGVTAGDGVRWYQTRVDDDDTMVIPPYDAGDPTGFWMKEINSNTTSVSNAPSGFGRYGLPASPNLLVPGRDYYVKVYYGQLGTFGQTARFTPNADCCKTPNCFIGGACVAPSTNKTYSCNLGVCASDGTDNCDKKPSTCSEISDNNCPSVASVLPAVCREKGGISTCVDATPCYCPTKNWIEVTP